MRFRSFRTTALLPIAVTSALLVAVLPAEAAPTPPPTLPGTSAIMKTISDLVKIAPRSTGSVGGKKAADYVAQRFRQAGLTNVHYETATSFDWQPSNYSLALGKKKFDAFPISHSFVKGASTPGISTLGSKGRTAQVVDIGSGSIGSTDVKGKWVLFDLKFQLPLAALVPFSTFLWDPGLSFVNLQTMLTANPFVTSLSSTIQPAKEAGALGVIGVLSDYFESNRYHNEYYRKTPMTLPGMWITKGEGAKFRAELARTGAPATMKLTVKRSAVTARTVVGFLEGVSKDTIMVQSHHDSQGPGAVEDASGTAEVIALADHYGALAKKGAKRQKTLMFATFDTHFTGYQSHIAFTKKYVIDKKTPYRIVANATIEHIGKQATVGLDGKLVTTNKTEPRGIFENLSPLLKVQLDGIVVANDLRSTAVLNATALEFIGGIPTDASFILRAGVPVVSLIAGPLYMYDEADTLDKIDQPQLVPVANAYRQIIDAIDTTPTALIGLIPAPARDLLPKNIS